MKFFWVLLTVLLSASPFCRAVNSSPVEKQKIILDADLDSDVDDVGALAMLLNMHNAGYIDFIGLIVTSDDPYAPLCASSINTFYNNPDIPIGFLKDQSSLTNHSKYTRAIATEFTKSLLSWEDAENATLLYRKLLAKNDDESVVIITIGHLTSLQKLLQSPPDEISDLTGKELVGKKVKTWVCMGGHFPHGKEANFYRPDPLSTVYCVNHWKKELVFYGWEAGNQVITGGDWLKAELNPSHPVYRGYELYNNFAGRPSWDQLAILHLTQESGKFFTLTAGTCNVLPDGSNTWDDDANGRHRYMGLNPEVEVRMISRFVDHIIAGRGKLLKTGTK